MKRYISILCFSVLISIGIKPQMADVEIVKAVWIEKFTRFIEWPTSDKNSSNNNYFIIAVFNNTDFSKILRQVYESKKINNKIVQIIDISKLGAINSNYQILYLSKSSERDIELILKIVKNKHILTISDVKGFSEKGIFINFIYKNERLMFEINESAVKNSDFYFNNRILDVSIIVNPVSKN